MKAKNITTSLGVLGCILLMALNLTVGAMSVGYLCQTIWGKRPHWLVSAAVGMFVAEVSIPVAVVAWGLTTTGIISPPLVKP